MTFGPVSESAWGRQDVAGFFEKAAAGVAIWCHQWGCRNRLNALRCCDLCGAVTCSEHVGLHWEKCHKGQDR